MELYRTGQAGGKASGVSLTGAVSMGTAVRRRSPTVADRGARGDGTTVEREPGGRRPYS